MAKECSTGSQNVSPPPQILRGSPSEIAAKILFPLLFLAVACLLAFYFIRFSHLLIFTEARDYIHYKGFLQSGVDVVKARSTPCS